MTIIKQSWCAKLDNTVRFDSGHYMPELLQNLACLQRVGGVALGSMLNSRLGITGGSTPLGANYLSGGVRFIRTQDYGPNGISTDRCVYVSEDHDESNSRSRLESGDVLLSITGVYFGASAVVSSKNLPANISQHSVRIRFNDTVRIDHHYLATFFNSPSGHRETVRHSVGFTRPALDYSAIRDIFVPIPSFSLQSAIGFKIRVAETLRELADERTAIAVGMLNRFFGNIDLDRIVPTSDGGCDYFSSFVSGSRLGLFHGSQFYSPKRQVAVDAVLATDCGERVGDHGRRVRSKGKRNLDRGHIDPANVSASNGYWSSGGEDEGGDVALAKSGHVLFLRMRPYLNKTTINETNSTVSASPEFLIYEFDGIDAFYSTLCLRQPWALAQIAEIATGDRPRIDGEFVDDVVIPWPDSKVREEIGQLYMSSFVLRRRADKLVQHAIDDVERLIEGTLDHTVCVEEATLLASEFKLELFL